MRRENAGIQPQIVRFYKFNAHVGFEDVLQGIRFGGQVSVGVSTGHKGEVAAYPLRLHGGFQKSDVDIELVVAVVRINEVRTFAVFRLVKIITEIRFGIAAKRERQR